MGLEKAGGQGQLGWMDVHPVRDKKGWTDWWMDIMIVEHYIKKKMVLRKYLQSSLFQLSSFVATINTSQSLKWSELRDSSQVGLFWCCCATFCIFTEFPTLILHRCELWAVNFIAGHWNCQWKESLLKSCCCILQIIFDHLSPCHSDIIRFPGATYWFCYCKIPTSAK